MDDDNFSQSETQEAAYLAAQALAAIHHMSSNSSISFHPPDVSYSPALNYPSPYIYYPETTTPAADEDEEDYAEEDEEEDKKFFKCPKAHCSKVYKNPNGLKYHLQKGTCDYKGGTNTNSIYSLDKPFYCRIDGCVKNYRNLNGLKYHARIVHPEMDFDEEVKGIYEKSP